MDSNFTDRVAIAVLCVVGMVGMVLLSLSDHVEAAVAIPPSVAALAAVVRNNQKIDQVTNQVAQVGNQVADLSNGELTDRIRAGFVQAMQDTGHVIVDPETVNHNDPSGKPYVPPDHASPPQPPTT